jgi:hypothetical protein
MAASSSRPALQPVPESLPQSSWALWLGYIASTLNHVIGGKRNASTSVTLAAGTTTTTLTDSRIGINSVITLMPTTANAAAELPTLYITPTTGSAVITHTNTAAVDRTFGAVIES